VILNHEKETMNDFNDSNEYNGFNGNNRYDEINLWHYDEDNKSMREIYNSNFNYDHYDFYKDDMNFEIKGVLNSSLPTFYGFAGDDPYSNIYNPEWRDHPNLRWGGHQVNTQENFSNQVVFNQGCHLLFLEVMNLL